VPTDYEKIGNSLTVIGSDQIEAGGYTFVPDVLRQVPGLAVSKTGPSGGQTQVRTRGAEGNHTVVLFNGVDVSDAGNGETDLSTLMSANIERIEVLRGPQSGLYGSNALAGVINILTRKNVDGSYYNGSAEYGTFNTKTVTGGAGIGDGKSYVPVRIAWRDWG
jgi:vitamin B12 transporter